MGEEAEKSKGNAAQTQGVFIFREGAQAGVAPTGLESFGNADCFSRDTRRIEASLPGGEAGGNGQGGPSTAGRSVPRGARAGVSPRMSLPPRSTESPVLSCSFLFGASCIQCGANLAAESDALGHNLHWGKPEHPPGVSRTWVGMLCSAPAQERRAFGCLCHGSTIRSGGDPQGTAATTCSKAGQSCCGPASPSDRLMWGDAGLGVPACFLLVSMDQQRETKAQLEPEHHV